MLGCIAVVQGKHGRHIGTVFCRQSIVQWNVGCQQKTVPSTNSLYLFSYTMDGVLLGPSAYLNLATIMIPFLSNYQSIKWLRIVALNRPLFLCEYCIPHFRSPSISFIESHKWVISLKQHGIMNHTAILGISAHHTSGQQSPEIDYGKRAEKETMNTFNLWQHQLYVNTIMHMYCS